MSRYREELPQLDGTPFLTDGGLETTLIYQRRLDLPLFASFTLLDSSSGIEELRQNALPFAQLAAAEGFGFIYDTPTWRASADWASKLGIDRQHLRYMNRLAVSLMAKVRDAVASPQPAVISGCLGPRGDGYNPDAFMTVEQAQAYHDDQIATFAGTQADMISAITLTYAAEAIGIARAARAHGMPVMLSFTLETDGRLPDRTTLGDAIAQVDAATDGYVAYYGINCAHPDHFIPMLRGAGDWKNRIRGLRANASRKSHAELDNSTELDAGNAQELAESYRELLKLLPNVNIFGGCCGTDIRHVTQIARAIAPEVVAACGCCR